MTYWSAMQISNANGLYQAVIHDGGKSPVALCSTMQIAERIVQLHNAAEPMSAVGASDVDARYPLDADGRTMLVLLGDDPNTLQHEPAREAARVLAYYWSSMDAEGVTPDKLRAGVADISQRLARWAEKVIAAQKGMN